MRNNFITKIIGATLAFAMMIGGAVGINAAKQAKAVFADNPVYTLGFTKNDKNSAYATAYTVTSNGIDWEVHANLANNGGYYIGGKGTSNLNRTFTSTDYLSSSIDKIVVHTTTLDAGSASFTAKASTSSTFASGVKSFSSVSLAANGDFEIEYDQGTDANSYFQLTFTVNPNNSKNNRKVIVTSIDFYEHTISQETITGVVASLADKSYYSGQKLSPTDFNLTVSWTGEKEDTHPTTGFTWTVNGAENGTLVEGNNSVVVTYQNVSSPAFNVVATIEHGTIETDPLTVGEAYNKGVALASKGETTTQYFIQGVVSEVESNNLGDGNYENATFWLQNGDEPHGFQAYRIPAADGCTNYNQLLAGAEVLIKCTIYKYSNSTIETGSVKSLLSISYTAPTLSGIVLNKSQLKLVLGSNETLTASPDPIGAELGDVTWESSNTDIATVDGNGKVTGVSAGSAIITATAGGFTATCDVLVELCAELDLTTTGAFSTAEDELLICEVADKLTLKVEKAEATTNANNYYPGKNNTSTRFYKNSVVTLTPNINLIGVRAEFTATGNSYAKAFKNSSFSNATATLPDGDTAVTVTVTFTDGMKPINVTIGGTCGFESVKLFYTEKTASQKVETNLTTQSTLAYHYIKDGDNYTYSNISVRFGGSISKTLWNELDTDEHLIAGIGVMITGYEENLRSTYSIKDHAAEAVSYDGDYNIKTQLVDCYVTLNEFGSMPEKDNNYYWNFKQPIDSYDDVLDDYTAAAYIKLTNGDLVFMQQVKYSVWSLAKDYLDNRNCNEETAGGSLYHLYNDLSME